MNRHGLRALCALGSACIVPTFTACVESLEPRPQQTITTSSIAASSTLISTTESTRGIGGAGGSGGRSGGTTRHDTSGSTRESDAGEGGAGGADCQDAPVASDPDAGVGVPTCGDALRDPKSEECDQGPMNGLGACSAACEVVDLVLSHESLPGGDSSQILATGGLPHALASGGRGFALGFVAGQGALSTLKTAFFDRYGQSIGVESTGGSSTLFPGGTGVSMAALPCGKYAAAWTDYGDDGDGAGVALRLVKPNAAIADAPAHANEGTDFNQVLQDMIWTGSELVVTWFDDSNLAGMGDLRVRTFDASLLPTSPERALASTTAIETSAVLAPFAGSWAAAWLAFGDTTVSIEARAGDVRWSSPPLALGALVDRPAIAALDDTRLLVVHTISGSTVLHGGILDVAAPGAFVPFVISPLEASQSGLDARTPSLSRVGERVYLSWCSTTDPSPEPMGDVWLKELPVGGSPGTIDVSTPEIPLPRSPEHRTGLQHSAMLAPGASPILVAAWQDAAANASRILVEAIPTPALRKAVP